jgi:hypothetical protein
MPGVTGSPISEYGYLTPDSRPIRYVPRPPRIRTSVEGLGIAVTVLSVLDVAMAMLTIGVLIRSNNLLDKLMADRASMDPRSLLASYKAAHEAAGGFIVFAVPTIVVFLFWFKAARINAEIFAPRRGRLDADWAVAVWFIPVAGQIMQWIVARDIYRGTMAGRPGAPKGGGHITGWWCLVYVAFLITMMEMSGALGRAHKIVDPVQHMHYLQVAGAMTALAMAMGATTAALTVAFVWTITKVQTARFREGWVDSPRTPARAEWPGTRGRYGVPVQDRTPFGHAPAAETQTADGSDTQETGERPSPPR